MINLRAETLEDAFEARHIPEPNSGCWLWTGFVHPGKGHGYGMLKNKRSGVDKNYLAHRLAWTLHKGEIPNGLIVCHRCDNRICVNPDHLFLGTDQDNCDDKISKGRARPPVGEANRHAKLTEDVVRFIRASELPANDIAAQFGITNGAVYHIRNRHTWRHVS